jgi:phosphotransferase system enzyme I (PtsP)
MRRARRSARAAAPASRGYGGAGQRVSADNRGLIAANMVREVCSVYVLRGQHARTPPPKASTEAHQTVLRRTRPGRPGRKRGQPHQLVGSPEPSGLRTARRPARRFITRSWASRPARWQYPRRAGGAEPGAAHPHRGGGGAQTTAMVLAEMIASGELSAIAARAEPAARRPP